MIDRNEPITGVRRWLAHAKAGSAGGVREDVLEYRSYRPWLNITVDAGSRLAAVVRRLCARRGFRPDTSASFAASPLANPGVIGTSRANSAVAAARTDSPAAGGLRADARHASRAAPCDDNVITMLKPLLATSHTVTAAQLESGSYDEGLRAGVQARLGSAPITPYQRVGLDEFARGFRVGYFSSRARGSQAVDSLKGRAVS